MWIIFSWPGNVRTNTFTLFLLWTERELVAHRYCTERVIANNMIMWLQQFLSPVQSWTAKLWPHLLFHSLEFTFSTHFASECLITCGPIRSLTSDPEGTSSQLCALFQYPRGYSHSEWCRLRLRICLINPLRSKSVTLTRQTLGRLTEMFLLISFRQCCITKIQYSYFLTDPAAHVVFHNLWAIVRH